LKRNSTPTTSALGVEFLFKRLELLPSMSMVAQLKYADRNGGQA
jgi:hypothetical protein